MSEAVAVPSPPAATASGVRHTIFWRETERVTRRPALEGRARTQLCIVGGGYTALWTSHFLKQADPTIDVTILEADYAGAGASGHNDGFVTPTVGHSLHTVVKKFGPDRAKELYTAVGRSILELRRFCTKFDVDAELEPNGFFLVATNDGQRRRLEHDAELAGSMGVSYDVLEAAEVRQAIDSAVFKAALKSPGATINPHKLARGLARVVEGQGVAIHDDSRALSIEGERGAWHVTTPTGVVHAEEVLIATDAYQHRFGDFQHTVKPVWSYAAVTEPLTDAQLSRLHWPGREGFVEARNLILFCRLTAENRLLVGGGPAPYRYGRDMDDRHIRSDDVTAVLRDALLRYFPALRDVRFSHAYGGCIGMTRDLVPHVGRTAEGIAYAYGYNGNGIAMTHTVGKVMRDLILENGGNYGKLALVSDEHPRFPADPFAFVGIRAASAALNLQDRYPNVIKRAIV